MRFGAHLPQIDFDGTGHDVAALGPYVDAARELGYSAVTANHPAFQRPWLDGLVALDQLHRFAEQVVPRVQARAGHQ